MIGWHDDQETFGLNARDVKCRGEDCGGRVLGFGFDEDCARLDANFLELFADDETEIRRRYDDGPCKTVTDKALRSGLEQAWDRIVATKAKAACLRRRKESSDRSLHSPLMQPLPTPGAVLPRKQNVFKPCTPMQPHVVHKTRSDNVEFLWIRRKSYAIRMESNKFRDLGQEN
jgi:hypothetical protein